MNCVTATDVDNFVCDDKVTPIGVAARGGMMCQGCGMGSMKHDNKGWRAAEGWTAREAQLALESTC